MSQSTAPGFVGFVVEIESYTEAKAIVYTSDTVLLRYGALALIEEPGTGKQYLALVLDVSEHSMMPSIDQQKLSSLTRLATSAQLQDARKLLELLFSPSQSLITWHGVRELELRILGEIENGKLVLPSRPPRPSALVKEPDKSLLNNIVSAGLAAQRRYGLYMGSLAYNPGVEVYLDPHMLTMHVAVVGQTGSGKTETVKRLVAEYAWRKELFSTSGGIMVFDIAGEYTGYPYRSPDTYPVLDAAMKPWEYTELETAWLRNAKKTIIVPLDLASIGFRTQNEKEYIERDVAELLRYLETQYGGLGAQPKALIYLRHHLYYLDTSGVAVPVDRGTAASLIVSEPFLVIGIPLPSSLLSNEVEELSHSTSPAFRDNVETLADMLGLLELGIVNEVKGFSVILQLVNKLNKGAPNNIYMYTRDILKTYLSERAKNGEASAISKACGELRNRLRTHGFGFIDCHALVSALAYINAIESDELLGSLRNIGNDVRELLRRAASYHPYPSNAEADPGISPWEALASAYEASLKLESMGIRDTPVSRMKRRLEIVTAHLGSEHSSTRNSIIRGMRRVERHVSAHLDAQHYRLIVDRALQGFTIVLLAPPSRGDTDHVVARLIHEAFTLSVRQYEPKRRTLLVIEEAHNLAPASSDKASKHMLLRVAREGRKWGLSLVLVTQRPGFIDPDVLSQAATLIALRITNPDDIAGLRRGSESVSQELVDRLPDLERGQAVIAGLAVPERRVPLLVKIAKLEPARKTPPGAQGGGQGEKT